jgi:catechol 2,3-dioxygenase-like lactoylglutathione lyase family enzyme
MIPGEMTEVLQFLELSLPAADVRKSLGWYRELGLIEHATNDVRPYHYAVVGDGDFCIGLHGERLSSPAMTFVRPNLASHVRDRMDAGEEFEHAALGIDDFHEAVQTDPGGSQAIVLEARTFSPSHTEEQAPLCGTLHSIVFPCAQVEDSLNFWQRYGFITVESDDRDHAELHAPGLVIELHAGTRNLTLRFQPTDYDETIATLNRTHELKMFSTHDVKGVELSAPEGTNIQLVRC